MATVRAFVGIGANLDDPARQVQSAIAELGHVAGAALASVSSLYRTPPMGPPDQPDYVNAAVELETVLAAEALLDALQAIERAHKRIRGVHWGPRTLDLDLLLYGDAVIDLPRLKVPHPGIADRVFVVEPLAEIAPELIIPGHGPLARLRAALAGVPIERVGPAAID